METIAWGFHEKVRIAIDQQLRLQRANEEYNILIQETRAVYTWVLRCLTALLDLLSSGKHNENERCLSISFLLKFIIVLNTYLH